MEIVHCNIIPAATHKSLFPRLTKPIICAPDRAATMDGNGGANY
jgi:hypothetical protein